MTSKRKLDDRIARTLARLVDEIALVRASAYGDGWRDAIAWERERAKTAPAPKAKPVKP